MMKIDTKRTRKGISTKTGVEWTITQLLSGPTLLVIENSGKDEDLVTYDKSDSQQNFVSQLPFK
jgi:hypothetical protein